MPGFLTTFLGSKAWAILRPMLPYLAIAVLVWWGADMRADVAKLRDDIAAEQAAHKADVDGLTALAKGIATVSVDTKRDQQILTETIKDADEPVSAQLGAYLDGLRNNGAAQPAK
jgi:hypothetical protein